MDRRRLKDGKEDWDTYLYPEGTRYTDRYKKILLLLLREPL
jgi:hypothetical protein